MSRLADFLGEREACLLSEIVYLSQATRVLNRTASEVRELFEYYGENYIYTRGVIVENSKRNRRKMTEMYGACVVLSGGKYWVITERDLARVDRRRKRCARMSQNAEYRRESRERYIEYVDHKSERELNTMVRSCSGVKTRKRVHDKVGINVSDNLVDSNLNTQTIKRKRI